MKKILDNSLVVLVMGLVGYLFISNIYFRVTHPEYTETQLFLKVMTFGGYEPIKIKESK